MVPSRLVVRLGAVAVAIAVVWYIVHLQSELAQMQDARARPADAAPAARQAAPEAAAVPAAFGRQLTAEQRAAMIARLGGEGMSIANPVWFATVPNDSEATAFQRALQRVFEDAGWQVRGNTQVRFPMKAGVFVFAADEEPPEYVSDASEALEAGGVTIAAAGRGYRDFYQQKKQEDPGWVGLEMEPDATYVIVVGRRPAPEPAS